MSWATHKFGASVVLRITGARALRLTPKEARELAAALLVSAESVTQKQPHLAISGAPSPIGLDIASSQSQLGSIGHEPG